MNFRQKVAVAVLDILVIGELCVSMYFASQDPDNLTPVFFKNFLCMVIPTLLLAKVVITRLRSKEPDSQSFE
jgi:Ni/Fe-hydrogenase subunit HybB-like protein